MLDEALPETAPPIPLENDPLNYSVLQNDFTIIQTVLFYQHLIPLLGGKAAHRQGEEAKKFTIRGDPCHAACDR
jgi:hypothetical protein